MAGENTVTTLNGLFKKVYADKLLDLVPDFAILQKLIEFAPASKELGDLYAQPVNLSHEAGFTYAGEAGGVTSLANAVNGQMKEAQVRGSELILRSQMSYTALSRASKQGEKAFRRASAWKIEDMNNATRKRLEIAMLYGQKGLGTVSAISETSATVGVITISDATWAGGIWVGSEGATLDSFTGTALNNGGGALTITAVDVDNKKITVTYGGGSPFSAQVAVSDVLYFRGSAVDGGTFNEMAGLQKIITNSGELFNISAATYSLWKGTTVSSVGQLSHAKIQDAVARAQNKGLMSKCLVLVSPKGWSVLNADQAALRMFDGSYSSKKFENGAEALTFHASSGPLEVRAHPFVKDGDAFIIPMEYVMRLGSVDLTFGVPGFDEQFFTLVSGSSAVEIQCMCDQAIFIEKPAHCVYMTGITYA